MDDDQTASGWMKKKEKKQKTNTDALLADVIMTGLALATFLPHRGQKEEPLPDRATWTHFSPPFPSCGNWGDLSLSKGPKKPF